MPAAEFITGCPICGKPVPDFFHGHQQKYCSFKCKTIANGRAQAERRRLAKIENAPMIACPVCNTEFKQYNGKKKYCSVTCSLIANKAKQQLKHKMLVEIGATRTCRTCATDKPVAEFYEHMKECKRCQADKALVRMLHKLHTDEGYRLRRNNLSGRRKAIIKERNDGTVNFLVLLNERKTCPYCLTPITKENAVVDHLDPIKLGGANSQNNLTICCRECNSRKAAKPYHAWVATLPAPRQGPALLWYKRKHGHGPEQASLCFSF